MWLLGNRFWHKTINTSLTSLKHFWRGSVLLRVLQKWWNVFYDVWPTTKLKSKPTAICVWGENLMPGETWLDGWSRGCSGAVDTACWRGGWVVGFCRKSCGVMSVCWKGRVGWEEKAEIFTSDACSNFWGPSYRVTTFGAVATCKQNAITHQHLCNFQQFEI